MALEAPLCGRRSCGYGEVLDFCYLDQCYHGYSNLVVGSGPRSLRSTVAALGNGVVKRVTPFLAANAIRSRQSRWSLLPTA